MVVNRQMKVKENLVTLQSYVASCCIDENFKGFELFSHHGGEAANLTNVHAFYRPASNPQIFPCLDCVLK